ncbi:MAG: hypothetical protein RDU89_09105 [bacterium]|nr:hypothetical protein [bacterium]
MIAGSWMYGLLTAAGTFAGWLLAHPGEVGAAVEALILAGSLTTLAAGRSGYAIAGPLQGLVQLVVIATATALLGPATGRWAVVFAVAASLAVGEATRRRGTGAVLLAWLLVLGAGFILPAV